MLDSLFRLFSSGRTSPRKKSVSNPGYLRIATSGDMVIELHEDKAVDILWVMVGEQGKNSRTVAGLTPEEATMLVEWARNYVLR